MTDHLTNARACVTSAWQTTDVRCAISWLTATCEQIIAHLEAQQAPQQPATTPPAAQQGDSGHGDGGEAARPNLNAQTGYTPTTDDVETWYVGNHDPAHAHEFRRWLAGIRAMAWDEAVDTLSRHWEDVIPAQIADLDRRNPYRKEQP